MDSVPTNKSDEVGFSEVPLPPEKAPPTRVADEVSPPKVNKERLRYVILDSLDARKTREEIREKLMMYGYTEIDADRFIEEVEQEQRRTMEYDDEVRGDPRFFMLFGSGVCLFGVSVLFGCFIAASIDLDLAQNPLWMAGLVIGAVANFVGVRLFWSGLSQRN